MPALGVLMLSTSGFAQSEPKRSGLILCEGGVFDGYTLLSPLRSTTTYLIDMRGTVVHKWKGDYVAGHAVYLLENGHLLKSARGPKDWGFHGGGLGGLIREFDWDGKLVWEFDYCDRGYCQHHDIEPLSNGNILILAWERKTAAEAIAAGRDPELLAGGELWPDHVIEVQPDDKRGGKIVWEWRVWDHLIQDFDKTKANYGVVEDHPELIDINFTRSTRGTVQMPPDELRRLRSLGYIGGSSQPRPGAGIADWNHTNSVAYNAELDQIILSVLAFDEVWIIDHSTTTEQAAGHVGGKCGKGGDLLYRWGNPLAYRAGRAAEQQLFAQHDARWISTESTGVGHILVLNNGRGRPGEEYTSVDEFVPPQRKNGTYVLDAGGAYGPAKPSWSYTSPSKTDFYSGRLSGAERLPNGNTLICSGEQARLFEINPGGTVVWEYVSPFGGKTGKGGPRQPRSQSPGNGDEPNALFRATRIAPDYPGLQGRDLPGMNTTPDPRGAKGAGAAASESRPK